MIVVIAISVRIAKIVLDAVIVMNAVVAPVVESAMNAMSALSVQ